MKDLNIDLFKIKKVEIFDNSDHSHDFGGYEIEFDYRPIVSINIPKSFIETILSFKNLLYIGVSVAGKVCGNLAESSGGWHLPLMVMVATAGAGALLFFCLWRTRANSYDG